MCFSLGSIRSRLGDKDVRADSLQGGEGMGKGAREGKVAGAGCVT